MADVSKLKKAKSRLGTPPSAEETATGLVAPEVAPLHRKVNLSNMKRVNQRVSMLEEMAAQQEKHIGLLHLQPV